MSITNKDAAGAAGLVGASIATFAKAGRLSCLGFGRMGMIRPVAAALIIGALPLGAVAQEQPMSARVISGLCGSSDPAWIGVCYGYAKAVADMYNQPEIVFCLPENLAEVAGAISDDLYGKTDLHFQPATQAIIFTLSKSFRC